MDNEESQIINCNKDPISNECEKNCKLFKQCWDHYMKLEVRIPFFIVDRYLPILSRHATNILLFLARRANFAITSNNFGRCWATHEQIAKNTNVPQSNIRRYTAELVKLKLIEKFSMTKQRREDKTNYNVNSYSVTWFKRMQKLKMVAK